MKAFRNSLFRTPRRRGLLLCVSVIALSIFWLNAALAQESFDVEQAGGPDQSTAPAPAASPPSVATTPVTAQTAGGSVSPPTTGEPDEPPLEPPIEQSLPTGEGSLSLGQFLLTPQLGLYTLYDTNVHGSSTIPLAGPGFHFHPSILADRNTGIWDTQFYANIDSDVYPTLDYHNNTFNKQAGFIQSYSPLEDLTFNVQGDYSHSTLANVVVESLPSPITSSATPPPAGAIGVVAAQQTVVNPNDNYTLTGSVYKQMNRAFVNLTGVLSSTDYAMTPTQNFNRETYNGAGGFWFTPVLYAFGDGIQSFSDPEVGAHSNYFRARTGIGTATIGFFQGYVYYGQQGTEVNGFGKAGGDIYGGSISYFPTPLWNMSFSVDRLRNISNITGGAPQGLGGLQLTAVGVSPSQSVQTTVLAYKTDYTFSPQTTGHLVVSDTFISILSAPTMFEQSWLVDVGLSHQMSDRLTLSADYQFSHFVSPTPDTSILRNLITAGANYRF